MATAFSSAVHLSAKPRLQSGGQRGQQRCTVRGTRAAALPLKPAPQWRHLGSVSSQYTGSLLLQQQRRRRKVEDVGVQASLLGVGAPEAVMIGVVALVVFGPKGLAEAAKSLGKAARSLQPTLRELAEVSSDLKNTIEDEIGLDEIKRDFQGINTLEPKPRTTPLPGETEEGRSSLGTMANGMDDPDIEKKRAESAAAAWGGQAPATPAAPTPDAVEGSSSTKEAVASKPEVDMPAKSVSDMSVEELQAEIARRSIPKNLSSQD